MTELYDMHCHLDFADNCEDVAKESDGVVAAVDSTVIPSSFVIATEKFAPYPGVHVGLGIHPWWIADGRVGAADVMRFETLVPKTRIIGEVGLDFHGKRRATRTRQLEVFSRILEALRDAGNGRLVFLHALKSYNDMFAMLEHYGTLADNTCVFHWFQGSRDDFDRALADGFSFSVSTRMMSCGKGELFARKIPDDCLLIETDNPPHEGEPWSLEAWEQELRDTARGLAALRNTTEEAIIELTAENSRRLLRSIDSDETAR